MKNMFHPPAEDLTLAGVLYALGDPNRLAIVHALHRAKEPMTCMDAVAALAELPVSTRSHCFRILREAGVIRSEKRGRECYNTLRTKELERKFPGVLKAILKASI